jgi:PST family polysaccharide transporter
MSKSALWSAADLWVQQISQLLTFIIVGSLLGPAVVGVMTMALITILSLATLLESGFADALIQRSDLHPEHFNSAFWLMLLLGIALAAVLWLATPIVALAFSEPQLDDILPIMGIALPCIAVTDCYSAMLRRELKFRSLAIRSISAYGSALVAASSLAMSGYGIYSLGSGLIAWPNKVRRPCKLRRGSCGRAYRSGWRGAASP